MIYNYGSEYADVFRYIDEDYIWSQRVTDTSQVIKAEIIHGIREEMAQKLSDIIIRRTELGSAGNPGDACIKTCASIMATEMGWSKDRTRKEIEDVMAVYPQSFYQVITCLFA
jgi:glycerol-3-phosphate dehydrogenase